MNDLGSARGRGLPATVPSRGARLSMWSCDRHLPRTILHVRRESRRQRDVPPCVCIWNLTGCLHDECIHRCKASRSCLAMYDVHAGKLPGFAEKCDITSATGPWAVIWQGMLGTPRSHLTKSWTRVHPLVPLKTYQKQLF